MFFLQGMKDGEVVNEYMIINLISCGIDLFLDYEVFKELVLSEELWFIIFNIIEVGIVCDEKDCLEDWF